MVDSSYQIFVDIDATALEGGYVWVGAEYDNPETNPVPVFWDEARTIVALQPLRTSGGYIVRNGTPANVFTANATYSIVVNNSRQQRVFYTAVAGGSVEASRIAFPIPSGPPGGAGPPGPAANSFATIAGIQSWAPSNLSAILTAKDIGGIFAWVAGDLSASVTIDPLHRFWIPLTSNPSGTTGAWVRQDSGNVDIMWFGAVADAALGASATDNATAFERACAVAGKLGRAVSAPAGSFCVSRTFQPPCGFDFKPGFEICALPGTQAYWAQTLEGDPEITRPIVRLGWHFSDNGTLYRGYPANKIKVRGLSMRTSMRSSDPATSGFLGIGILFDESCKDIDLADSEVGFCYKNIVFNNKNGHLSLTNVKSSNGWFNRYYERQTGDFRNYNCDLTGPLFASTGSHDTVKDPGIAVGGFIGLIDIGVHEGFGPYAKYIPDSGTGTVGMGNCTFIDCSAEQLGNCYFKGGWAVSTNRTTGGCDIRDPRMNFTSESDVSNYNAYTIQGDSNFPPKEPMRLTLVQGARMQISGFGLARGTFNGVSAHTIVGTLQTWFRDEYDPSGITVVNNDKALVLGIRPVWTTALPTAAVTLTTGGEPTLVSFGIPSDLNNTTNFLINMRATSNNSNAGPIDAVMKQKLNGVAVSGADITVTIPPGKAPFNFPAAVGVAQNLTARNVTFTMTTPTNGVSLTAGQATFQSINPGAV